MNPYLILTSHKAKEFIEKLDLTRKAKIDRIYNLFKIYGNQLPSKYLKKLNTHLWELRPGDVRLFLTIRGNQGIVIHGILKKTQKTPKNDLELAKKRVKELENY